MSQQNSGQVIPASNGTRVAVPHKTDAVQVLRNLGFDMTGCEPISTHYDYPKLKSLGFTTIKLIDFDGKPAKGE